MQNLCIVVFIFFSSLFIVELYLFKKMMKCTKDLLRDLSLFRDNFIELQRKIQESLYEMEKKMDPSSDEINKISHEFKDIQTAYLKLEEKIEEIVKKSAKPKK